MEFEELKVQILVFSAASASEEKLKNNNKLDILFSIDTFNVWAIVIRTTKEISYDDATMLSCR